MFPENWQGRVVGSQRRRVLASSRRQVSLEQQLRHGPRRREDAPGVLAVFSGADVIAEAVAEPGTDDEQASARALPADPVFELVHTHPRAVVGAGARGEQEQSQAQGGALGYWPSSQWRVARRRKASSSRKSQAVQAIATAARRVASRALGSAAIRAKLR